MVNDDAIVQTRFTEAVREQGPALLRLSTAILGSREAAEDACQQAFLKAWQQFDRIQSLPGWLHRVVVHESFAQLRRRKIERQAMNDQPFTAPMHDHANQVAQREQIVMALSDLPDATREIVVLRLLQGMTGNEVKIMLGCSASEVSRRLHDGMEKLRVALRDEAPTGGWKP